MMLDATITILNFDLAKAVGFQRYFQGEEQCGVPIAMQTFAAILALLPLALGILVEPARANIGPWNAGCLQCRFCALRARLATARQQHHALRHLSQARRLCSVIRAYAPSTARSSDHPVAQRC